MGFTLQTYKNSVDVHVVRKYSVKRIQIYIYKHSLLSDIVEMKLSIFLMLSLAALSWAEGDKRKKSWEQSSVLTWEPLTPVLVYSKMVEWKSLQMIKETVLPPHMSHLQLKVNVSLEMLPKIS